MYNGIGLETARGSGTNGYVQRNISAIRKTKEKVPDYHEREDTAVRPFDPELVEHERRRQAEVRCLELRELLEEQDLPESEIDEKVNAFRNKLLAEKKLSYQRDLSGRPLGKDSHEFSLAQEQKNSRAKDAFGIREDFIPGSSLKGKELTDEMSKELKETPSTTMEEVSAIAVGSKEKTSDKEKSKKRKKSHKRSRRSSSSNSSSSDEESHRKKRKKEKKKKSKKSHRHRRDSDSNNSKSRKRSSEAECDKNEVILSNNNVKTFSKLSSSPTCCIPVVSSESPSEASESNHEGSDNEEFACTKYSLSVVDFSGHHKYYPALPNTSKSNGSCSSHVDAIQKACLPIFSRVSSENQCPLVTNSNGKIHAIDYNHSHRSRSSSSDSKYSSRPVSACCKSFSKSRSRSNSKSRSLSRSRRSISSRSRSGSKSSEKSRCRSKCKSHSISSRSRSHSAASSSLSRSSRSQSSARSSSRSLSRSPAGSVRSAVSKKSHRSRSPSIPRRRGSPSFMERRRITSARKRPIPYKRKDDAEWNISSGSSDSDD